MTVLERKLIVIGVVTVITIIVAILGYEYLKGNHPFKPDRYFYAVYQNVYGLSETAPVKINGVTVGQISNIRFDPNTSKVIVEFLVEEKNIRIPVNSVARIYSSDMLGTKALEIVLSGEKIYHQPGDTLVAQVEPQLSEYIYKNLQRIDSIVLQTVLFLNKIHQLFNDTIIQQILAGVDNIRHLAFVLDTSFGPNSAIQSSLNDLAFITSELRNQTGNISQVIENTKNFTDTLAKLNLRQSLNKINSAIDQIDSLLDRIEQGQGTIGQIFINDTLYFYLDSLARNLNILINTLNKNPKDAFNFSLIKIK